MSEKTKTKVTVKKGSPDWHRKIASARGEKWRKNMLAGRREAQLKPSIIRLARIEANIHQSVIAGKIKVSESTFGAIERAKRPVKEDTAKAIAALLKRPVNRLFKQAKANKFVAVIVDHGV